MSHHLGYDKNQPKSGTNTRNGYSTKTVATVDGPLELCTPRDREATFEPQQVKKNKTRITGMDNQILSLLHQRYDHPRDSSCVQRVVWRWCLASAGIEGHRCRDGTGCRMAKSATWCSLSYCLSWFGDRLDGHFWKKAFTQNHVQSLMTIKIISLYINRNHYLMISHQNNMIFL